MPTCLARARRGRLAVSVLPASFLDVMRRSDGEGFVGFWEAAVRAELAGRPGSARRSPPHLSGAGRGGRPACHNVGSSYEIRPCHARAKRIMAALGIVLVVFVGFTLRLYVFPAVNAPERSDAIFALGGSGEPTEAAALKLTGQGYAPLLVFSLRPNQQCHPAEVYIPAHVTVSCFHANPQTTQGEARSIAQMAKAAHLRRIIVVAPTSQVTRARLRVRRCFSGQILMVGVSSGSVWDWAYAIPYEWGATIKALTIQRGC